MEFIQSQKIRRPEERHQAEVSKQTGFPSPATHYQEAKIDLNKELLSHTDAAFFVRVKGDDLSLGIHNNDVLIIDRALSAKPNNLALTIEEGEFKIKRIPKVTSDKELLIWGVITYVIHAVL